MKLKERAFILTDTLLNAVQQLEVPIRIKYKLIINKLN